MRYTIKPGCSFLDSDGSVKTGGQTIELTDEAAAANLDKVDVEASEVEVEAKAEVAALAAPAISAHTDQEA